MAVDEDEFVRDLTRAMAEPITDVRPTATLGYVFRIPADRLVAAAVNEPAAKPNLGIHNRFVKAAAHRSFTELEPRLARLVEPILRNAGKTAAKNFTRMATRTMTASAYRDADRVRLAAMGCDDARALLRSFSLQGAAPPDLKVNSTMVCLKPTAEQQNAVGGDHDTHVTLVYLGEYAGDLNRLADILAPVAASFAPLSGVVAGDGEFGPLVQILLPDVPGLVELRVAVTEALIDGGVSYATDHGYTAHMTREYLPGSFPADVNYRIAKMGQSCCATCSYFAGRGFCDMFGADAGSGMVCDDWTDVPPPPVPFGAPLDFADLLIVRGDRETVALPLVGSPPMTASAVSAVSTRSLQTAAEQQAQQSAQEEATAAAAAELDQATNEMAVAEKELARIMNTGDPEAIRTAERNLADAKERVKRALEAVTNPEQPPEPPPEKNPVEPPVAPTPPATTPITSVLQPPTTIKGQVAPPTDLPSALGQTEQAKTQDILTNVPGLPDQSPADQGGTLQDIERAIQEAGYVAQPTTAHLEQIEEVKKLESKFQIPAGDELLNVQDLSGQIRDVTDPVRRAVVQSVGEPIVNSVGLQWDESNPFSGKVLAQSASQITSISETTQANVMQIIQEAHDNGWSIPDTAKAIQQGMADASPERATLIARTELAGAVNGGSLAATQIVQGATGVQYAKVWTTAPGARYPRHENYPDLDGQVQNSLDGLFTVGDAELRYPGDPDGPPGEVCNCRCTLIYQEVSDDVPATAPQTDGTIPDEAATPPTLAAPVEREHPDLEVKELSTVPPAPGEAAPNAQIAEELRLAKAEPGITDEADLAQSMTQGGQYVTDLDALQSGWGAKLPNKQSWAMDTYANPGGDRQIQAALRDGEVPGVITFGKDDVAPSMYDKVDVLKKTARDYTKAGIPATYTPGKGTREPGIVTLDRQEVVGLIDQTIADAPALTEPVTVFRGLLHSDGLLGSDPKVGDVFTEKGYSSTTVDPRVAEGYAAGNTNVSDSGAEGPSAMVKVTLPTGYHAFWNRATRYPDPNYELTLPRDTAMQIDKITIADDGTRLVDAHVMPAAQTVTPVVRTHPALAVKDPILGITPFRAGEDNPLGFYDSAKAQQFEADLKTEAAADHLTIQSSEHVTGVWQGEQEPAYTLHLLGDQSDVQTFSENMRAKYDQDNVMVFTPEKDMPQGMTVNAAEYTIHGVDGEKAVAAMGSYGFEGATVDNGNLVIVGKGGLHEGLKAKQLAEEGLGGARLTFREGHVQFVSRPVETETSTGGVTGVLKAPDPTVELSTTEVFKVQPSAGVPDAYATEVPVWKTQHDQAQAFLDKDLRARYESARAVDAKQQIADDLTARLKDNQAWQDALAAAPEPIALEDVKAGDIIQVGSRGQAIKVAKVTPGVPKYDGPYNAGTGLGQGDVFVFQDPNSHAIYGPDTQFRVTSVVRGGTSEWVGGKPTGLDKLSAGDRFRFGTEPQVWEVEASQTEPNLTAVTVVDAGTGTLPVGWKDTFYPVEQVTPVTKSETPITTPTKILAYEDHPGKPATYDTFEVPNDAKIKIVTSQGTTMLSGTIVAPASGYHVGDKYELPLQQNPDLRKLPPDGVWQFPEGRGGADDQSASAKAVSGLVDGWAATSADSNPWALAVQNAVHQEFGVTDSAVRFLEDRNPTAWKDAQALYAEKGPALRAFVRAQYDNTQQSLADAGIHDLTLYRGFDLGDMSSADREKIAYGAHPDQIALQPASSFSSSYDIATGFVGGDSAILGVQVPASRIMGSARTGNGSLAEKEFVVLGPTDGAPADTAYVNRIDGYSNMPPNASEFWAAGGAEANPGLVAMSFDSAGLKVGDSFKFPGVTSTWEVTDVTPAEGTKMGTFKAKIVEAAYDGDGGSVGHEAGFFTNEEVLVAPKAGIGPPVSPATLKEGDTVVIDTDSAAHLLELGYAPDTTLKIVKAAPSSGGSTQAVVDQIGGGDAAKIASMNPTGELTLYSDEKVKQVLPPAPVFGPSVEGKKADLNVGDVIQIPGVFNDQPITLTNVGSIAFHGTLPDGTPTGQLSKTMYLKKLIPPTPPAPEWTTVKAAVPASEANVGDIVKLTNNTQATMTKLFGPGMDVPFKVTKKDTEGNVGLKDTTGHLTSGLSLHADETVDVVEPPPAPAVAASELKQGQSIYLSADTVKSFDTPSLTADTAFKVVSTPWPGTTGSVKVEVIDPGSGLLSIGATKTLKLTDTVHILSEPPEPFTTADPAEAAQALANGVSVTLTSKDKISTFIDDLGKQAADAQKAGKDAPTLDLGKVTVAGTNLFTQDSLGIPRIDMPQLSGVPLPGSLASKLKGGYEGDPKQVNIAPLFYQSLRDKGVVVKEEDVLASHLKPTQDQLNGTEVAKLMDGLESGKMQERRIPISSDNYIVDGHHEWAATIGADWKTGQDAGLKIPVDRIDEPITQILDEANAFAAKYGIPQQSVNVPPVKEALVAKVAEPIPAAAATSTTWTYGNPITPSQLKPGDTFKAEGLTTIFKYVGVDDEGNQLMMSVDPNGTGVKVGAVVPIPEHLLVLPATGTTSAGKPVKPGTWVLGKDVVTPKSGDIVSIANQDWLDTMKNAEHGGFDAKGAVFVVTGKADKTGHVTATVIDPRKSSLNVGETYLIPDSELIHAEPKG